MCTVETNAGMSNVFCLVVNTYISYTRLIIEGEENMKEKMLYKILVVAVIVLFVGMGVQPAVAVTPETTENDDDCDLCPKKVSKSHLVLIESLLNRIDKYDTQLSALSKQYPEFEEKYKEISEGMMSLREVNKYLESDEPMDDYPYPIICNILRVITLISALAGYLFYMAIIPHLILMLLFYPTFYILFGIGLQIGCWDDWPI